MKIKNTLDWPDHFLRRMVSWCCKQIDLPVRYVTEASFAKSRSTYSGRAYLRSRSISVRIRRHRTVEQYEIPDAHPMAATHEISDPVGIRVGGHSVVVDREDVAVRSAELQRVWDQFRLNDLVVVTAHELSHLEFYRSEKLGRRKRSRRHGCGVGGSEQLVDHEAHRVLREFWAKRDDLVAEWSELPKPRTRTPKPSLQDRRAVAAMAKLSEWERKLKLAKTKVQKYKSRVRYYERVAAKKSG